jgi:hypothetical protein
MWCGGCEGVDFNFIQVPDHTNPRGSAWASALMLLGIVGAVVFYAAGHAAGHAALA